MMDRNDLEYFKRPTSEVLESMFDGYDVPESIKARAKLIMKRFTILGLCDGMYIANTIASENGSGDGCGNFDSHAEITKIDPIVKKLMNAYGSNIFASGKDDLTEIVRTGELPKKRMIEGLQKSIRTRRKLISAIRNQRRDYTSAAVINSRFSDMQERMKSLREADKEYDLWRIEFLYGEINVIRDTLLSEKAA